MSDFFKTESNDDIDAILNEFRGEGKADVTSEPSKEWSMADIDRLIAQSDGEDYEDISATSDVKTDEAPKTSRFFSEEFDEGMFTLRPVTEEKPAIEDVSSGEPGEMDGQESFFSDSDFSPELFEIETVIMPEDEGKKQEIKYNNKTEHTEPLPPSIDDPVAGSKPGKDEGRHEIVDYRERFFKKLTLDDIGFVPDSDPLADGPVEKSGTVLFKNEEHKQDDFLDPMPTVKAAEDVKDFDIEKTKIAGIDVVPKAEKPAEKAYSDVEGQIVLTGFDDIPEESRPEKDSENVVEENLWQRRRQKAKDFKVDTIDDSEFGEGFEEIEEENAVSVPQEEAKEKQEEKDTSLAGSIGEYTDPADRSRIHTKLASRMKKARISTWAAVGIEAVLALTALLVCFGDHDIFGVSFFTTDQMIIKVVSAVLLIALMAVDSERIFDAFRALFRGRFSSDTAVALVSVVALIETTVMAVCDAQVSVLSAVAGAAIVANKAADLFDARRIYDNFSVCAFNYDHNMYAVHAFENESEIFELGRGLLMGNAELLYSSNVEFPTDFIKNSDSDRQNEKHIKLMLLISLVGSVAAAIAAGIVQKSFYVAFAAFTAALCLSAPVFGKFIPSYITYIHNHRINHDGTMIVSLDAAEKTASANAIVLDAADIFDRKNCTMHGMKNFDTMRVDVVLLYAAAMVIKSGGPLKECFEQVIDGRNDLLPPVRELVYEDKMGISARIYEQKVLLGNRNMLTHHNIAAPDKSLENRYSHDGRKVIYLACNEKLAALFVVSYSADEEMKFYLRQLEKSSVQTLVRTNDVNVTEELISERFGIDLNNFKILSSVAGRLYKRRKDFISETLETGVIHDGKASSMLKAVATSCKMVARNKLGTILQFVLLAVGIALAILMGCSDGGITVILALLVVAVEILVILGVLTPFEYFKK